MDIFILPLLSEVSLTGVSIEVELKPQTPPNRRTLHNIPLTARNPILQGGLGVQIYVRSSPFDFLISLVPFDDANAAYRYASSTTSLAGSFGTKLASRSRSSASNIHTRQERHTPFRINAAIDDVFCH
jgi:hypothetical protein